MIAVRALTTLILPIVLLTGCESMPNVGLSSLTFGTGDALRQQEEKHRKQYQETRDPAALDWLFANVVTSGMTQSEITRILGEEGRRVYDDGRFKNEGGHYQIDDDFWKWGPDSEGRTICLGFRDGHLVNFDPNEFR